MSLSMSLRRLRSRRATRLQLITSPLSPDYSFCSTGTGYGEAAKLFHFHFDDLVFFRQSSKKFTVMRIQVEWFIVRTSSSLFILYARARGKEVKVQRSRSHLSCTSFLENLSCIFSRLLEMPHHLHCTLKMTNEPSAASS